MPAGARQATRLRRRYLQAVLRQDAAFFDASAKSGALLLGLNEDTSAIQLAIGEKVLLLSHKKLSSQSISSEQTAACYSVLLHRDIREHGCMALCAETQHV